MKTQKNPAAVALGKLAAGHKKTMTPAAIAARKANAKLPRKNNSEKLRKVVDGGNEV